MLGHLNQVQKVHEARIGPGSVHGSNGQESKTLDGQRLGRVGHAVGKLDQWFFGFQCLKRSAGRCCVVRFNSAMNPKKLLLILTALGQIQLPAPDRANDFAALLMTSLVNYAFGVTV